MATGIVESQGAAETPRRGRRMKPVHGIELIYVLLIVVLLAACRYVEIPSTTR